MRRVLILGGSDGIGLGIATALAKREEVETVYIVDSKPVDKKSRNEKFKWYGFSLDESGGNWFFDRFMFFDRYRNMDIDGLIITPGFGSPKIYKNITGNEIESCFRRDTIPAMRLIQKFYDMLDSKSDFYCGVFMNPVGHHPGLLMSAHGAASVALKSFILSVNLELKKSGSVNTILEVCPGNIDWTSLSGDETDSAAVKTLAKEIIRSMEEKRDFFIPGYQDEYIDEGEN